MMLRHGIHHPSLSPGAGAARSSATDHGAVAENCHDITGVRIACVIDGNGMQYMKEWSSNLGQSDKTWMFVSL